MQPLFTPRNPSGLREHDPEKLLRIVGRYHLHVTEAGEEVLSSPNRFTSEIITVRMDGTRVDWLWTPVNGPAWNAMRRLPSESGWSVECHCARNDLWVRRPARFGTE